MWRASESLASTLPAAAALEGNLKALASFMQEPEAALDTFRRLTQSLFDEGWRPPTVQ